METAMGYAIVLLKYKFLVMYNLQSLWTISKPSVSGSSLQNTLVFCDHKPAGSQLVPRTACKAVEKVRLHCAAFFFFF